MNKRSVWIFLCLFMLVGISYSFTDSDLDGVDDSVDQCPDTPFDQLVGKNGCPINEEKGQFYLKIGGSFTKDSQYKNLLTSVSLAYSYKNWYFSLLTNYYLYDSISDETGFGDSYIYGSYSFDFYPLYITAGLTVGIPTGGDNLGTGSTNLTPSFTADYILDHIDIFLSYGFVFRGENSENIQTISIGAGYQLENSYINGSFDVDSEKGKYVSFFILQNITEKYYLTLDYSYGLNKNATKHFGSLNLGVRF